MTFEMAIKVSDVPATGVARAKVGKHELAIVKFGGNYYCFDGVCTHEGGPLGEGTIEGDELVCPWHEGKYKIESVEEGTMPETGPVIVIPYNARWPRLFEEEKGLILRQIGPQVLAIEHVGSTAVPGLASKPTLDILVGVRRLEDAKACVGPLADVGYEYVPEYEAEIPDRRYFHKGPAVARTHHLHMVEFGGAFWTRNLLFRDWLRTHPEDARRYAARFLI